MPGYVLIGHDTFDSSDYQIEGEHETEPAAIAAAQQRLRELEQRQPSSSSGGQAGIQDQVYVRRPDGTRFRVMPSQVLPLDFDRAARIVPGSAARAAAVDIERAAADARRVGGGVHLVLTLMDPTPAQAVAIAEYFCASGQVAALRTTRDFDAEMARMHDLVVTAAAVIFGEVKGEQLDAATESIHLAASDLVREIPRLRDAYRGADLGD